MVQSVLHICLFIACLSAWTIDTWAESDAKKWLYIRLSIKSLFNNRMGVVLSYIHENGPAVVGDSAPTKLVWCNVL